jgi:cytoskeletal protein RodZ
MSYILDALKKSQAEQNAEGVSLATHATGGRKPRPRGLLTLVIFLVTTNIGLLLWVTLQRSQSHPGADNTSSSTSEQKPEETQPSPSPLATATRQNPEQQAPASLDATPPVQSDTRTERSNNLATQPSVTARPKPKPRAAPAVKKLQLSELPASEQSKFNSFNYSSHIYTDDPELCAVVINGQRLSAGDRFEGMEVIAITEEGVVFGSSRVTNQGQREQLHVAVSVIEQWER